MRTVTATALKARCLSILDEVARTGETVTITKRGRPVARIVPPVPMDKDYPQQRLSGRIRIVGDIVSPALPPEAWEAEGSGK